MEHCSAFLAEDLREPRNKFSYAWGPKPCDLIVPVGDEGPRYSLGDIQRQACEKRVN